MQVSIPYRYKQNTHTTIGNKKVAAFQSPIGTNKTQKEFPFEKESFVGFNPL